MTRENLIKAIYDNAEIWSCPNSDCGDKSAEEYKINDCIRCAEKLLSEYEQQIRADAINECIEALGNNFWDIAKLEQLKSQDSIE